MLARLRRCRAGWQKSLEIVGEAGINAFYLEREFSFMDIPNQMYQGSLTVEKREPALRGGISQCELSLSQCRELCTEKYFHEIQSGAASWQWWGRNGSGKTTFIKLLCRLYDPTEGQILLNGIDIRKYDYREYMRVFSVVFQDFHLLAFSVGQNIAARESYDRNGLRAAARRRGVAACGVDGVGNGYRAVQGFVREGCGGVRRRGAEACGLREPCTGIRLLILDEPTAALDPLSEYEIYARLSEIVEDKTAVYISHRLSSCRFCDEILVFIRGVWCSRKP